MSTPSTIDLKKTEKYIPARSAADRIGYSIDYVSRLAREGKIAGERRGRQWHVDVESLKLFSLEAKAEQRRRQEQLREDRKAELLGVQKKLYENKQADAIADLSTVAFGKAAVVSLSLALLLTLTWNVYDARLNMQALSIGAFDVGAMLRAIFVVEEKQVVEHNPVKYEADSEVLDEAASTDATGLVVFTDDQADVAAVAESFSDEVEVEFFDEHSGVIRPVFKEASADAYRFLLVPVTVETE